MLVKSRTFVVFNFAFILFTYLMSTLFLGELLNISQYKFVIDLSVSLKHFCGNKQFSAWPLDEIS
jgi:hypothetical protein